jgi:hypothetical protein
MNGGKMSISFGMNEPYGNFLMSRFRLKLRRILKKIIEFVRALIPKRRREFKYKVEILGDVVHPKATLKVIQIDGEKDFKKLLWLILDEDE